MNSAMKRRTLLTAGVGAAASLLLTSCGTVTPATQSGASKTTGSKGAIIGIASASTQIPFLAALNDAITDEAKKNSMSTVILDGKLDNATQAANVTTLISKRVNAIIVISSNPTAPVSAIAQANQAGIPVFAISGALDEGAKIVTYIGGSDFAYGKAQGELLLKALPNGGKVATIMGPLGDTAQVQRLAGLQAALQGHPNVTIIDKSVDEFDSAKNLAATQDLLSKYPKGALNAVVCQGPEIYVGANYARKQGRDDILFIAGDYPTQIEAAIKTGAVYGTVDQSPSVEGKLGAQYVRDWLDGNKDKVKRPKNLIDLPPITKANVNEDPSGWTF